MELLGNTQPNEQLDEIIEQNSSFRDKAYKYIDKYNNLLKMIDRSTPLSNEVTNIQAKHGERPKYTDVHAFYIYFNVYKSNDARCLVCHSTKVQYSSWYPLSTTNNSNTRTFHLDHMIPFSESGNNSLLENIAPICITCNSIKSVWEYSDFIVKYCISRKLFDACINNNDEHIKNIVNNVNKSADIHKKNILGNIGKLACKNTIDRKSLINHVINKKGDIYYSDFLNITMTRSAKLTQYNIVKQWFLNFVGFEPINDLIILDDDIYLSAYSQNKIYTYGRDKNNSNHYPLINTLIRLMKLQQPLDDSNVFVVLTDYLSNGQSLKFSDFFIAQYSSPDDMINKTINMINIINAMINNSNINIINDITYSLYSNPLIANGVNNDEINLILQKCKNAFLRNFNEEPVNDIMYNNGIIIYNNNVQNIHMPYYL